MKPQHRQGELDLGETVNNVNGIDDPILAELVRESERIKARWAREEEKGSYDKKLSPRGGHPRRRRP